MQTNKHKRPTVAFLYLRAQHEQAAERMAEQESSLRDHASQCDYRVAAVFKDEGSARDQDRPGFRQLLESAYAAQASGDHVVVLVTGIDRLARNLQDFVKFEDLRVELPNHGSAAGRFIVQVQIAAVKGWLSALSREVEEVNSDG